jgi:hypothetical protein
VIIASILIGEITLENKPGRVRRIKASGGRGVLVIVGVTEGVLVRVGEGPSVGVSVIEGTNVNVLVCEAVNVGNGGVVVGEVKKGNNVDVAGDEEEISEGCRLEVAVNSASTIASVATVTVTVSGEKSVGVQFVPMKINAASNTNRGIFSILEMLS